MFESCILSFPNYSITAGVLGKIPVDGSDSEFILEGEIYPPKDSQLRKIWKRTFAYYGREDTHGLNGLHHVSFPTERIVPTMDELLGYDWQFNDSSGRKLASSLNEFIQLAEESGRTSYSGYLCKLTMPNEQIQVIGQNVLVSYFTAGDRKGLFSVSSIYDTWIDRIAERWGNALVRHNDEDLPEMEPEEPRDWSHIKPKDVLSLVNRMSERALKEDTGAASWTSYKRAKDPIHYAASPKTIFEVYKYELRSKQPFPSHELVMRSSPYKAYNKSLPLELNHGLMLAWANATEQIPVMTNNMFQNVLSVRDNLADFAFGSAESMVKSASKATRKAGKRRSSIQRLHNKITQSQASDVLHTLFPEYAKNMWLRGRYEWSTSWMDAGSSYNVLYDMVQSEMNPFYETPVARGTYTDENGITYRCSFAYKEKLNEGLQDYFASLYKYGLQINPEVIWDFIPYSFVVDWFLPVGDWLAANDRAYNYGTQFYEFKDGFCFSTKYRINFTYGGQAQCYTRWYASEPPVWDIGEYAVANLHDSASQKTKAFRALDAIYLATNFI